MYDFRSKFVSRDAHPWTDDPDGSFDERIASSLTDFSQRISRRGVLAKSGRLLLGALGFAVANQIYPVVPEHAEATHGAKCGDWDMCGLLGYICGCPACTGNNHKGPACGRNGGAWTHCCRKPDGTRIDVAYEDFYKNDCSWQKVEDCHCHWCANKSWPGFYGGTSTYYMCTRINRLGTAC